MQESEPKPRPVIEKPTLSDVESYRTMQAQSWLDTYPNDEAGVSYDWVKAQTDSWLTPDALEHSRSKVDKILHDTKHQFLYVAKVADKSVGMVHTTSIEGNQRLEALYVAKDYHGTSLAQDLISRAFAHLDLTKPVVLEVLSYNDRAQSFYKKNGFKVQPDSDHFYKEIMPSIKMIRLGDIV